VSIAFVPTSLAEILITTEWPSPVPLRFLLTGGDTLHVFPRADLPFTTINNYGLTECTVVVSSGPVPSRAADGALPTIGKPIAGVTLHLLDAQAAPVAPGWPGEIHIGGPSVGRGYRNRPELTAARFIADPFSNASGARLYRTGDLASMLPNGELCFRGRVDNQVKVRGYRVEPEGVAAALDRHPAIASCAVIARDSAHGDKQLVAYVVASSGQTLIADELRSFLAESLPEYMIPAYFVALNALPLNSSGKLDRNALPKATRDNSLESGSFRTPTTPTEIGVAAIVAAVLGLDQVGADDNFFTIGGHSLLAAQVVMHAQDAFGVALTVAHLFEAPTIASLAAKIEALRGATGQAAREKALRPSQR
jgi:acyl-CoA synthetase (AMP-forming)/AMP-acid ligase II/acyl carrier protein